VNKIYIVHDCPECPNYDDCESMDRNVEGIVIPENCPLPNASPSDKPEVKRPSVTMAEVRKTLDFTLRQEPWERGEDIVTMDGEPIGGTISNRQRLDLDRFIPGVKDRLASRVAEFLRSLGVEVVEGGKPEKEG